MVGRTLEEMIKYFGNDVRRINHALKVYGFATAISAGQLLTEDQRLVIDLASILHDVGIKVAEEKYHSSAGHYQELEGPPVARKILKVIDVPEEIIERVCFLVGNHHSYNKIDAMDFQILVEADFLVNMYEDQMGLHEIETVRSKIFKTPSGMALLSTLYGAASRSQ